MYVRASSSTPNTLIDCEKVIFLLSVYKKIKEEKIERKKERTRTLNFVLKQFSFGRKNDDYPQEIEAYLAGEE